MGERHDGVMDAERFADFCEAYGGSIERWPEAERAAATIVAMTSEGQRLLAEATRLDAMLDRFTVSLPSAALERRILTMAQRPGGFLAIIRSRWAGLGLVGVGLAGAATGAVAIMLVLSTPVPDDGLRGDRIATVFGDIGEGRSDHGEVAQ